MGKDYSYKNSGTNSQGNHYCSRDYGNGGSTYTSPSGQSYSSGYGNSGSSGQSSGGKK
ncbi:hypothetical protein Sste5346_000074 [Sporothrix stenoceras]|uniref:Uncharacterized protein n=1 Tax=Sporothrix stenoceras TaxID=5173 RepID=A0ABR3ZTI6_9PEZI